MAMDSSDVTAGTNATATHYNNLRKDLRMGKRQSGNETDAATVTIDWSDTTKGLVRKLTLAGNRTLVFSNYVQDQFIMLRVAQDATGNRTLAFPASCKWAGGSAPTLSTGASKVDIFCFYCLDTVTPLFDSAIVTMGLS